MARGFVEETSLKAFVTFVHASCQALVARGESVGGGLEVWQSLVSLDGSLLRANKNICLQI
jgi:hypothetical protein